MKKFKKIIKNIIIIILVIGILMFLSMSKDIIEIESMTEEERKEMIAEEYKEFLDGTKDVDGYYDTLEEAMENSEAVDVDIQKILKEIEVDNNYIIIGPSISKEGTEDFSIARLKTKADENGKKKYSNIISARSTESDYFSREGIDDKYLIHPNFLATNRIGNINDTPIIILEKYPSFAWSLSALEDIKYLEIQGKRPDEVIPFEMDGKTFYFYYYEDLKIEGDLKEEDFVINKEDKRK